MTSSYSMDRNLRAIFCDFGFLFFFLDFEEFFFRTGLYLFF